ncbi:MAG: hypothetical protein U1F27_11460 [Turneriella sp.]
MGKKTLLLLVFEWPLAAGDFRPFGAEPIAAQIGVGSLSATLSYLFVRQSMVENSPASTPGALPVVAAISAGYTLGILFSGSIFGGKANPFATLAGNLLPFIGPLIAYHLSEGSALFSDQLSLFNLQHGRLTLGLPCPYRKTRSGDLSAEALFYLNIATITF